jgi:hypothetical protein
MTMAAKGGTHDRITHQKTGAPAVFDDPIDEVVVSDLPDGAHVEMMNRSAAWMRLGEHVFWISARGDKLTIRYTEHRPARSDPTSANGVR